MVARQTQETLRGILIAVILTSCLLLLQTLQVDRLLRGPLEFVLQPVVANAYALTETIKWPLRAVIYVRQGSLTIADLEQRLTQIAVDYDALKRLEQENASLKQLIGLKQGNYAKLLPVALVARGSVLTISSGTNQSLVEGQLVVDGSGVLVGRVAEVGRYTARVKMPIDRDSLITVAVRSSGVHGVLTGKGEGLELGEVLQSDPLRQGDVLVTSGEDDSFPPGIVVGVVDELLVTESAVTKGAVVRLLANLDEHLFVMQ